MIGIAADGFEIVVLAADAQAFLRARGAHEGQTLLAEKNVFELNHPRVGEKQGRVFVRHEGRAADHGMALFCEIIQEGFANFTAGHHSSINLLLSNSLTDRKSLCCYSRGAVKRPPRGCAVLDSFKAAPAKRLARSRLARPASST